VKGNGITKVPDFLYHRTALLHLSLSNNRITELATPTEGFRPLTGPESPIKASGRSPTRQATGRPKTGAGVPVGGNWWEEEQTTLLQLNGMQHLICTDNFLEKLPTLKGSTLTHLNLARNRLGNTSIKSMLELGTLRVLRLPCNRLTEIPGEIELLRSLVLMDMSRNGIEAIPRAIKHCKNLTSLFLNFNKIQDLPHELFMVTTLQQLQLSGNLVGAIPVTVGDLSSLRELLLDGNLIMSLPLELGKLTKMEKLALDNNPGNLLPAGFEEKGMEAVMEYFAWNCQYSS